jgi:hypothetical protein
MVTHLSIEAPKQMNQNIKSRMVLMENKQDLMEKIDKFNTRLTWQIIEINMRIDWRICLKHYI